MRDFLNITTALADENRIRALMALRHGELCVCQVVELLKLAPSTTSKHLSILRQAGLVEARKQARWMYYALSGRPDPAVRQAIAWVRQALEKSRQVGEDDARLMKILQENPEEICRRQAEKSKCCSSAPATPVAAKWPKAGRAASKMT